jgi:hypothetical protein
LLRPRLLQYGIALDHLVRSQRVFEYSLEHVDHHAEAVLEVGGVPRLLIEQVFDHLFHYLIVAGAVDGGDVEELGDVKELILVNDASVEIHAEVLALRLHVLRQSVKYFEHQLQLLADERLQLPLYLFAAAAELAAVQVERLVQINLQLVYIVVFSDVLQERVEEVNELRYFGHEEPEADEWLLGQVLHLLRNLPKMKEQFLLREQIVARLCQLVLLHGHDIAIH